MAAAADQAADSPAESSQIRELSARVRRLEEELSGLRATIALGPARAAADKALGGSSPGGSPPPTIVQGPVPARRRSSGGGYSRPTRSSSQRCGMRRPDPDSGGPSVQRPAPPNEIVASGGWQTPSKRGSTPLRQRSAFIPPSGWQGQKGIFGPPPTPRPVSPGRVSPGAGSTGGTTPRRGRAASSPGRSWMRPESNSAQSPGPRQGRFTHARAWGDDAAFGGEDGALWGAAGSGVAPQRRIGPGADFIPPSTDWAFRRPGIGAAADWTNGTGADAAPRLQRRRSPGTTPVRGGASPPPQRVSGRHEAPTAAGPPATGAPPSRHSTGALPAEPTWGGESSVVELSASSMPSPPAPSQKAPSMVVLSADGLPSPPSLSRRDPSAVVLSASGMPSPPGVSRRDPSMVQLSADGLPSPPGARRDPSMVMLSADSMPPAPGIGRRDTSMVMLSADDMPPPPQVGPIPPTMIDLAPGADENGAAGPRIDHNAASARSVLTEQASVVEFSMDVGPPPPLPDDSGSPSLQRFRTEGAQTYDFPMTESHWITSDGTSSPARSPHAATVPATARPAAAAEAGPAPAAEASPAAAAEGGPAAAAGEAAPAPEAASDSADPQAAKEDSHPLDDGDRVVTAPSSNRVVAAAAYATPHRPTGASSVDSSAKRGAGRGRKQKLGTPQMEALGGTRMTQELGALSQVMDPSVGDQSTPAITTDEDEAEQPARSRESQRHPDSLLTFPELLERYPKLRNALDSSGHFDAYLQGWDTDPEGTLHTLKSRGYCVRSNSE